MSHALCKRMYPATPAECGSLSEGEKDCKHTRFAHMIWVSQVIPLVDATSGMSF